VGHVNDIYQTPPYGKNLSVTIAIPCYNAENFLGNLLDSLFRQTRLADEILVINDGSTDATRQIAQGYEIVLFDHKENLGLAHARNTALWNAKGDIIVFLDADTLLQPGSLENILLEYNDPETIAVGGQELFTPSSTKVNLWRNLFWRQTHGQKRITNAWMLMGLCCSYRRKALINLDGFNVDYKTNGEDVDMGIRLFKAGSRQIYEPKIGVFHKRSDSLKSLLSLVFRHSYWQSRALRNNGINPSFQMLTSIKWLFISMASSIFRHKNFVLVLLSFIANSSAIMGRSVEYFSWKK
jgi:glycosyltransferase involved in cell wall biosynthesis